ncbi:spore germination protein [Halobacillus shinanisalinarum]|uniref:Spore germination protein n=1 Tax=Halobacillus shinanisalinarum TaxID=2932258 RepID=A0ABY4H0M5_9BACI|nr:GerAB/ArcD/ProY family transporter [Halobacillus shinanisalinarum]UOQ93874.1 spore germination protein [Halobacillus shinanisalinarum]
MKNGQLLTKLQVYLLLIQAQFGIGLLSLPNLLGAKLEQDAWFSILIAGTFVQFTLFIYWLLIRRFPGTSYHDITKMITGKYIGTMINATHYIGYLAIGTYTSILVINLVNNWLLPFTPVWAVGGSLILISVYLVINDFTVVARFFVLLSIVVLPCFLTTLLMLTTPLETRNLMPLGDSGFVPILKGSHGALLALLGFELILFMSPYVNIAERKLLRTFTLSNLTVTILYTLVVILSLMVFSPNVLGQVREPVLYMFRALSFQTIDRIDLLFVSIWIGPMTASIMIYLLIASKSLAKKRSAFKKLVISSGGIMYVFILLATYDQQSIDLYSQIFNYCVYTVVFFLPCILLILSYLLKKKKVNI